MAPMAYHTRISNVAIVQETKRNVYFAMQRDIAFNLAMYTSHILYELM